MYFPPDCGDHILWNWIDPVHETQVLLFSRGRQTHLCVLCNHHPYAESFHLQPKEQGSQRGYEKSHGRIQKWNKITNNRLESLEVKGNVYFFFILCSYPNTMRLSFIPNNLDLADSQIKAVITFLQISSVPSSSFSYEWPCMDNCFWCVRTSLCQLNEICC